MRTCDARFRERTLRLLRSGVTDRVGSAEPHGVVDGPVDRLGGVASPVEASEVGVGRGRGRTFSVRLNRRRVSSALACSRMVMVVPPMWAGTANSLGYLVR